MTRQACIYGGVTALAIFLVGWVTGMGGSFLPNLLFSLLMGLLAGGCYLGASKLANRSGDDQR